MKLLKLYLNEGDLVVTKSDNSLKMFIRWDGKDEDDNRLALLTMDGKLSWVYENHLEKRY